jgi:hypothetical protein
MEKQQLMLRGIEHHSEIERLELFNVEELETRLEMAVAANGSCASQGGPHNMGPKDPQPSNSGCW